MRAGRTRTRSRPRPWCRCNTRCWSGSHCCTRTRVSHRVDADVIRVGAQWTAVFYKVAKGKATAGDPGRKATQCDAELGPYRWIAVQRIGRVDVQQKHCEIADVSGRGSHVCTRAVGAHPHLKPIRQLRFVHSSGEEGECGAVLQAKNRCK